MMLEEDLYLVGAVDAAGFHQVGPGIPLRAAENSSHRVTNL
jgi:hypothetical protein